MKTQIKNLSPHQNGKVLSILVAIGTLPIFLLMMVPMIFMMPNVDNAGNPIHYGFPFKMFLFMPVIYLVITYISISFFCWLYNNAYRFLGGLEFEFLSEVKPEL